VIKDNAISMHDVSNHTNERTMAMSASLQRQLSAVEQIATAVTEMSSAANEVAQTCVRTADVSEQGLAATRSGKEVITRSASGVNSLGASIQQSSNVIQELEQHPLNHPANRRTDQPAGLERRHRGRPCRRAGPWVRGGG
jgi:methyl-accepting chemotaxis protein